MTQQENYNHDRQWALDPISYEAICTTEALCAFRNWLTGILEKAYDAGYNNAKTSMAGVIIATSPEYYTRKEFGEKFRICPATVQNWCNDGTIKVVRIGGRVLIPASQFEGLEDGEKLSATKIRRAQRQRGYGL